MITQETEDLIVSIWLDAMNRYRNPETRIAYLNVTKYTLERLARRLTKDFDGKDNLRINEIMTTYKWEYQNDI